MFKRKRLCFFVLILSSIFTLVQVLSSAEVSPKTRNIIGSGGDLMLVYPVNEVVRLFPMQEAFDNGRILKVNNPENYFENFSDLFNHIKGLLFFDQSYTDISPSEINSEADAFIPPATVDVDGGLKRHKDGDIEVGEVAEAPEEKVEEREQAGGLEGVKADPRELAPEGFYETITDEVFGELSIYPFSNTILDFLINYPITDSDDAVVAGFNLDIVNELEIAAKKEGKDDRYIKAIDFLNNEDIIRALDTGDRGGLPKPDGYVTRNGIEQEFNSGE